ncbi:alpha/beta fold hydrolase [Marinilabiliaceae bacterium JC017]|nr:alpha/beta fold hydrolase [Marinilabiliaceae bacterium JC017]
MQKGKIVIIILCGLLISCTVSNNERKCLTICETRYVNDDSRNRIIPIEIYSPCSEKQLNKELVVLSAGYWCVNTGYSYISKRLSEKGYLVVAIQHELETDVMLPCGEDMYKLRLPNWKEGVKSIQVVLKYLKKEYPNMRFDQLNLIGHSNGGDISMLFATEFPDIVKSCVTLDHRRMPIPVTEKVKIMSIRADEYAADEGVIPSASELAKIR